MGKKKQSILQEILEKQLEESRLKNPRYSIRALAKRLQISPSSLSRLLAGKSNLSKVMTNHLIERLNLAPEEKAALLTKDHDPYIELQTSNEIEPVIRHWYYSGIMCLAETKDFQSDAAWIADRLGIKLIEARKAIRHLQKIGFLRKEGNKLIPADIAISTTDQNLKVDPRVLILDKMKLLRSHVVSEEFSLKDFSDIGSIMVSTSSKKIPQAKVRLKTFRRNLAKYLDSGENGEVYLIFTQLIPLSNLVGRKS